MSSLPQLLSDRIEAVAGVDPELRPATKPQFGHFQSNVALRLAKAEGRPPREVAARLVEQARLDDLCEPPEIAGPGFINLRLRTSVLAEAVTGVLADPRHGVVLHAEPDTVVVDYSAPNVAKQMHVGHLRSTIIGDCLTRVLRALGDTVVPQNHVGDWGRQFGMLVEQSLAEDLDVASLDLAGAEALYRRANDHFKTSETESAAAGSAGAGAADDFADRARRRVVALQSGDEQTLTVWRQLIEVSQQGFNAAYRRLGVLLSDDDLAGESIYNEDLPVLVADLEADGTAVVDDGALCVFVEGFAAPMIVRKRDGGFGYSATDLAAIRHRVRALGATRIVYVVGAEQTFHFNQVFAVARKAGFLPDDVRAEHVGYGMVLGADGKRLRTRDGATPKLSDLLDAAEQRATPAIALAAVKYADLSNNLVKDYAFDVDRMVQTTGDTGPYLQYAHARLCQLLARAAAEQVGVGERVERLDEPAEQTLALLLTRFGETVEQVGRTLQPHRLCSYLYELSGALAVFYEQCPVLRSEGEVRASRLALCTAVRDVLASGLDLLGVEAPERM